MNLGVSQSSISIHSTIFSISVYIARPVYIDRDVTRRKVFRFSRASLTRVPGERWWQNSVDESIIIKYMNDSKLIIRYENGRKRRKPTAHIPWKELDDNIVLYPYYFFHLYIHIEMHMHSCMHACMHNLRGKVSTFIFSLGDQPSRH